MAGSSGGPGDGGRAAYEPVEDAGSGDALPADASAAQHALHYATAPHTFFKRLVQNFGWQFTVQLAVMYLFVKGVLNSGIYLVMLPFCQKTLGVSGEDCQTLGAIAATPFALKGAIGVTSDMVVLFGYHKLALIVTSAAIGTTAVLLLAVLPIASAGLAAVLLFCANLQTATCDLLHEGRYSELMQAKLSTGPAIVSFVWGCWSVGGLIASCIVGPVADAGDPQLVFWVLLPCAASILIPTALNFLGDPQVEDGGTTVKWEVADKSPSRYSIYLALILALCALLNAMVGLVLFDAKVLQMCVGLCLAAVLVVLAHLWLPPTQRSCNLYMFASSMLYVNIQGALDYWYTADEACAPHGPHFNYVLYVTVAHVMASVASLVGIFVFQGAMSGWTYRSLFVITTVLQVVAGTVDVIIIERGNLALGIPDEYFYLGGNAVVRPLVFMVSGLPAIVLTSRLVSEGLSSTTYALLAGYQHLGHIISQQVGVVLIQAAGLSTVVLAESEGGGEGGECDWENLSFLVVLCHMVLPLFSLPLVYLLIPDKTMHVEVLTEADTVDFDPAPDAPRPVQASSSDKAA